MVIDETSYVDKAEQAICKLKDLKDNRGNKIKLVSTSKIRNLLAMTADIYNEVMNQNEDTLSGEICSRIEYLRIRFVYESGREEAVKRLVQQAQILEILKEIGNSKRKYILFSRYMEALVAFRKYYGDKERD